MDMTRNAFIGTSAAALAAPAAAAGAQTPSAAFDRKAFEAILNKPFRHRQVFAATKLSGAAVLNYMRNSLRAYAEGFGEGPGTLHAIGVFYGGAVALGLTGDMWRKYPIATTLEIPYWGGSQFSPKQNAAATNPYAAEVQALVDQGAHFFLCNNVMVNLAAAVSQSGPTAPTVAQIHDDLVANLMPGTMVVPAGVAALNAAQEARFTLMQATIT
jgi:intracellular sulfur oxidation DsrE/DsrF family protein